MEVEPDRTPPGWQQILDESDAEIAVGLFVSAEEVRRQLREGTARLKAQAEVRARETADRH